MDSESSWPRVWGGGVEEVYLCMDTPLPYTLQVQPYSFTPFSNTVRKMLFLHHKGVGEVGRGG